MPLASRLGSLITRVSDEMRDLGDPYRRSVVMSLPIRFPGYTTVLSEKSYTYLFPQGFCYDGTELFIMYGSSTSMPWVSVHDATTGAYKNGFSLDRVFGESIQVVTVGGIRYLYMTSTNTMCRWNINTMPAERATLTPANVYNINAFSHFSYQSGQFIVQTRVQTSSGLAKYWFTRWNDTFTTRLGEVRFDPVDQWTIDAGLIPLNPKSQGFCSFRDGFAVGYGGGHVPGTSVWTPDKIGGIKIFDAQGNVIKSGLCDPNKMAQTFIDGGYPVGAYFECEGVATYNGELRALFCVNAHDVAEASTRGILITRELGGPMRFKDAASAPIRVGNQTRIQNAIHCPTGGALNSPIDGTAITTLEGVIEMMRNSQLYRFSFTTAGVTMTDLAGDTIQAGLLIDIKTANFYSWEVTLSSNLATWGYWIAGPSGALVQGVKRPFAAEALKTGSSQALTTSWVDVPGCSITVPSYQGAKFQVHITMDVAGSASTNTAVALMTLNVDGTNKTQQATFAGIRGSTGQHYVVEDLAAGNHTFKCVTSVSAGTGTYSLQSGHTKICVTEV